VRARRRSPVRQRRALYARVVAAVAAGADGAVPGLAVTDTIKVVATDGTVLPPPTEPRCGPCRHRRRSAHACCARRHASGGDGTDDAALVEAAGGRVVVVAGEPMNRKITHPDDLDWARRVVQEETT
jgi:2-C-methyl-D-erythritol 4-phosphate cytidylyltransferase